MSRAAEAPRTAAFVVDGVGRLTYADWESRSNAAARGLRDRGLGSADRVVLWFDTSRWSEFAVGYAAVHKAGAVPVPLGAAAGAAEVARVAARCGASAVVVAEGGLPGALRRSLALPALPVVRPGDLEEGHDGAALEDVPRPQGPVELAYRSGFLTRPEPRPRTSADVLDGLAAVDGARPTTVTIHSFAVGTAAATDALWLPLPRAGGPVVVLPKFDPERLCALTAEHRVERWWMAPAVALWLLESGAIDRHDVSSVAQVVLDGGRPAGSLLPRLADHLPGASVVTLVGPARAPLTFEPRRPGAVGRPVAPGAVRVVDGEQRDLPDGELGQVQLDGKDSGPGYADDGFLYLVPGGDGVVRRGGFTVPEADVVGVLTRHPAVADAAVAGVPDDGAEQAVVAVALRSPVDGAELRAVLRRELGEGRAPDAVVVVDQVPRNRSGVALRARLRRAALPGAAVEPAPHVAPRGEVEETIASVWERVLDREGLGVHEDFFELGGDQWAAAEVLSLLDHALDVRLPLSAALRARTISALASEVERRRSGDAPRVRPAPAAASQEGMVWHEQFAPGSQNLPPLVRRYRGPLDAEAFGRALAEIVRRHEPLRTTFELDDGRLVQVVSPPPPAVPTLPVRDLGGLPPAEQEESLARILSDAGRPFDLVEGPLFEAALVRMGPDDHIAVLRVHHSVYDDWSVGVFRGELSGLYAAMAAGERPPPAELPVSFSTFSRRQRRRLAGPAGTTQLRWWKQTLAGGPLGLELPIDDPDRPEGSPQPSADPVTLDLAPELSAHVRALARRQRATPFMTVLAAFEVLVHRYTGEPDLLLASVVANRNRTELEGMIGCFTKKVLLRQAVAGDASFAEVLARTRSVVLGALANQDLAFEAVVQEALGAPAALHGLVPTPVVMVQGVTPPAPDVVLPGITTSGYDTSATTRRVHFSAGREEEPRSAPPWGAGLYRGTFLILSVAEHDNHVSLSARGAFHRPAVERLLANFGALLGDAVAHPSRPVRELTVVDRSQGARLAGWSKAGDDDSIDRRLDDLFDEQVARFPSRLAVRAGRVGVTFAELGARADRLARRLRAEGVAPGTLVGLCLPPSLDCVVAVLGIWKAGAGYVGLDSDDADDRLAAVVADTSVAFVVAPPDLRRAALAGCRLVDVAQADEGAATDVPPAGARPSDPALAFYGSGPSAVHGGVVLSHRAMASLLAGLRREIHVAAGAAPLRVALSAAPTEDGFARQLVALLDGHTVQVTPPEHLASLVGNGDVDLVDCTPAQLKALGSSGADLGAGRPVIVVGVRDLPEGGAGPPHPSARLLFGPPQCSFGAGLVTAGPGGRVVLTPLAGIAASVLDAAGQPAPIGVTGELRLARPPEPAVDMHRKPHVITAGSPWGSELLARRRPDGAIELVGGAADALDVRGFRLDRAKLEAALRRHPGVAEVEVGVRGRNSGDERLVARVVPRGDRAPTLADVRTHLWAELPGYAWPSTLETVDQLPEPAAPADGGGAISHPPEALFLAALWADVLGIDGVAPDQNYWQRFSFLEVVTRAREAGGALSDAQVTRNRTIATLGVDMASEPLRRPRGSR